MAVIGNTFLTLADAIKSAGDKAAGEVVELLARQNPIVEHMAAKECNMGAAHLHSIRTNLPTVTWGRLYQGTPMSKTGKTTVTDTTGFVEGLSAVDTRLLDIADDPARLRMEEADAYAEAMAQEVARAMFYESTDANPERIRGLADRFNTLSNPQVVTAGGSGSDNTSIWFVTWGEKFCHAIYPKGTKAGLTRQDKGEQRVLDGSGNPYYIKEELFRWHLGLAVRDTRFVSRICNIDVSNMKAGSVALYDFMRAAYYKLQNHAVTGNGGKQCIYANRDVVEVLDKLASNGGSSDNFVRLSRSEVQGQEVLSYRGIPIYVTDALINTEAAVA